MAENHVWVKVVSFSKVRVVMKAQGIDDPDARERLETALKNLADVTLAVTGKPFDALRIEYLPAEDV
ncbi:hypothetical protein G3I32_06235 [Streptomyces coelicoflavus]|uniref:Uncharacterized protein n=1 Tax=Streptomyces coelicoflavus TaxID=285562 RepID=A0A7K3PF37_9ACTN|nr:hypothetical protein [Streptomyces coelicoflavus]NEB08473.1 hypothetical protein [Streptomyces coelicoflavus]